MSAPFQLPPLPWDESALEPVISARTIGLHYGKHHATYVKKLNELVAGTRFADMPLEHVIAATVGNAESQKIFNNAAQAWNHTFFWNCLKPRAGGEPPKAIGRRIEESFGGYAPFKEQFSKAAVETFGSGWAWLVAWEHAYYLDYENRRPEFVDAVIDKLLDWNFASEQLEKSQSGERKAA